MQHYCERQRTIYKEDGTLSYRSHLRWGDTDSRTTEERVKARDAEHHMIAEAIAQRDPIKAEKAMYDHLELTQRKLMGLGKRSSDVI